MSVKVKRRREAASFLSTFVGAQAELIVDTTNNRVQVHDGATAGGWPAAKLSEVVTNTRTAVSDAAYSALASDRTIAYTTMTAARVVTLPAASAYPTGTRLTIVDESGACSATNTITLARAGSDTIDGAASAVIASPYGYLGLQSNGSNKWTIIDQAMSNLSAVGIGTAADPTNPLSVYGTSALFNSAGNFNFTINKAASTNTASTIYQDGFSGRAQVGLCGDDNFHFKVSPDGSTWYDALGIANSSGVVSANFGITTTSGIFNSTGIALSLPSYCQLYTTSTGNANLAIVESYSGSSTGGPTVAFVGRGARGTAAAPSAVQVNDTLLAFGGRGYGASGFSSSNRTKINFSAAQNWTDTAQGSYISFLVTANNATIIAEVARLDQTGYLGIGTTTPTCSVDVNGLVRTASYTVATLPAASASLAGARSCVTDAVSPTFLGALTGGGSVICPVFCNGSAWVAG